MDEVSGLCNILLLIALVVNKTNIMISMLYTKLAHVGVVAQWL